MATIHRGRNDLKIKYEKLKHVSVKKGRYLLRFLVVLRSFILLPTGQCSKN